MGFGEQSVVEGQPAVGGPPTVGTRPHQYIEAQEPEPIYSYEGGGEGERIPERVPEPIEQGPRKKLMPIQKVMLGGM